MIRSIHSSSSSFNRRLTRAKTLPQNLKFLQDQVFSRYNMLAIFPWHVNAYFDCIALEYFEEKKKYLLSSFHKSRPVYGPYVRVRNKPSTVLPSETKPRDEGFTSPCRIQGGVLHSESSSPKTLSLTQSPVFQLVSYCSFFLLPFWIHWSISSKSDRSLRVQKHQDPMSSMKTGGQEKATTLTLI